MSCFPNLEERLLNVSYYRFDDTLMDAYFGLVDQLVSHSANFMTKRYSPWLFLAVGPF